MSRASLYNLILCSSTTQSTSTPHPSHSQPLTPNYPIPLTHSNPPPQPTHPHASLSTTSPSDNSKKGNSSSSSSFGSEKKVVLKDYENEEIDDEIKNTG